MSPAYAPAAPATTTNTSSHGCSTLASTAAPLTAAPVGTTGMIEPKATKPNSASKATGPRPSGMQHHALSVIRENHLGAGVVVRHRVDEATARAREKPLVASAVQVAKSDWPERAVVDR